MTAQRLEAIQERLDELDKARDSFKELNANPKNYSLWERQIRVGIERRAEQNLKDNAEADLRYLLEDLEKAQGQVKRLAENLRGWVLDNSGLSIEETEQYVQELLDGSAQDE